MFETREQLFEVLNKYITELKTIVAAADEEYEAAVKKHAEHLSDLSFDESDLAREEDLVETIYDEAQDIMCELNLLLAVRYDLFADKQGGTQ